MTLIRRSLSAIVGAALVAAFAQLLLAAPGGPTPYGEDFQVTSHAFSGRGHGAAMAPDGSFIIVWGEAFHGFGGRVFLADGSTGGFLSEPWGGFPRSFHSIDAAVLAPGEFVVVWEARVEAVGQVIRTRRFAPDGSPLALPVDLQATPGAKAIAPAVASDPSQGLFGVVWAQESPGTDGLEIELEAVAAGGPLGPIRVNGYTAGDQSYPELSVGSDSRVVVVWLSDGSPGGDQDGTSVQAAVSFGAGDQFQVNEMGSGDQNHADVAIGSNGDFLVVWDGPSSGDDTSIQGRLFTATGTPLGGDVQINATTRGVQKQPRVEARGDGSFLVIWSSPESLLARVVGADGVPAGNEFRINASIDPALPLFRNPGTATGSQGRFVVNWLAHKSGDYGEGMRARFLCEPLFVDGFESGDTSAWSSTVP